METDPEGDDFDSVLSVIGYGRWQTPSVLVTLLVATQIPTHILGSTLLSGPMAFRCLGDEENISINSDDLYFSNECLTPTKDNITAYVSYQDNGTLTNSGNATSHYLTGMESCPVIEYDTSVFTSTVISEFHLVCEREDLQPLFQLMYNVGHIIGSLVGGCIGDRWGRLRAVQVGVVLYIVVVLLMAFVPLFSLILSLRVVAGFTLQCLLIPAWSLALESTPTRHRSLVGMLLGFPYSVFVVVFSGVGYLIRSWRTLMLVCCSPGLLLLPLSFIMDDSPRWLLQQGRREEAIKVLKKAVIQNKVKLASPVEAIVEKLKQSFQDPPDEGESSTSSSLHLAWAYVRSPAMRPIIFVTPLLWFLQSCLYLSVAINANNFNSSDPYLYVCLSGVMDGTSILIITPLTTRLGRRVIVGVGLFVGGILFLLDLVVPFEYFWAKWVLVMSGFLLVSGTFQMIYVYGPELFPTEVRTRGFAYFSVIGGAGSLVAPIITYRLASVTWWAAPVTFGVLSILGSLTLPLLPETRNKPMPETLQDVEDRKRRKEIKEEEGKRKKEVEGKKKKEEEEERKKKDEEEKRKRKREEERKGKNEDQGRRTVEEGEKEQRGKKNVRFGGLENQAYEGFLEESV